MKNARDIVADLQVKQVAEQAESIFSSDRSKAHARRLLQLKQKINKDNEWWMAVIAALTAQAFQNYHKLKVLRFQKAALYDVAEIAWRARNLLELWVWAEYCTHNEANARIFYDDFERDRIGLNKKVLKWGEATGQSDEWMQHHRNAQSKCQARAAENGSRDVDQEFKAVGEAARDVGLDVNFKVMNGVLSKFAHPTAFHTLNKILGEDETGEMDYMYGQGCLCFNLAFMRLEAALEKYLAAL